MPAITGWRLEDVVRALQALRGIDTLSAIGLVAEIGDIGRFAHPRQLMGHLGLVPSKHSSGERVARGSITQTGNAQARRLPTEAAWNYRSTPCIGSCAQRRAEDLAQAIRDVAWKAQLRLSGRFARLRTRGVHINKARIAVARELVGSVWAIARTRARLPQH